MARVFARRARLPAPCSAARAAAVPRCSAPTRGPGRTGRPTRAPCSCFSAAFWRPALRGAAHADAAPVEPARASPRRPGTSPSTRPRRSSPTRTGSTTRGETTMTYFIADGRAGGPELRLRRRRHRRRGRVRPRHRLALAARAWASSDVDLTRALLYVLVPISIVVGLLLVSQGVAADARRPTSTCTTVTGGDADAGPRAGRLAGGDQAARHQRRRLLQRQLGDAVREPELAHQLRRACSRSC